MSSNVLTSAQRKENKSLRMNQLNTVDQKSIEENRDVIDYSQVFLSF
jgi:hypothetical protein